MSEAVLDASVVLPVKQVPGVPFQKGDPRISHNQRKLREAAKKAAAEAERNRPIPERVMVGVARDPLLTAYRHVLANEDGRVDGTIVEREVRALLASHRKEFLAKWSEMEQEERSFVDRKSAEGVEEDVGLEAAVGLLDRVLAEGIDG